MKKANDTNINLIIPKGTQIVLLNETKVLNENRFHHKGTVGKIIATPTDAFHAYQIEFPDGTRGMTNRKDFSIRKEFQTEQSGLIPPPEDYQLFDYVIYRCVVGSKAFGLDDANSDTVPDADLPFCEKEYERLVSGLEKESERSDLPDKTDAKADLNNLLIRLRLKYNES